MPTVHVQQDGGLLDVEVHPQYAKNGWIYLAYSEMQPGFAPPPPRRATGRRRRAGTRARSRSIPSMTVVVRGKINRRPTSGPISRSSSAVRPICTRRAARTSVRGSSSTSRTISSSRIGERGAMENAQDLTKPLGKIHRVNDDGTVPKDNPFVNTPGAVPTIWTYGHRNPEGLAWDPVSGKLWESEHGPNGGDEINIIERGHNYGWGVASKGIAGRRSPRPPSPAWTIRSSTTRRRSRRRASRSTPARSIPAGRTRACSSAVSSGSSCAGSRSAATR